MEEEEDEVQKIKVRAKRLMTVSCDADYFNKKVEKFDQEKVLNSKDGYSPLSPPKRDSLGKKRQTQFVKSRMPPLLKRKEGIATNSQEDLNKQNGKEFPENGLQNLNNDSQSTIEDKSILNDQGEGEKQNNLLIN